MNRSDLIYSCIKQRQPDTNKFLHRGAAVQSGTVRGPGFRMGWDDAKRGVLYGKGLLGTRVFLLSRTSAALFLILNTPLQVRAVVR